MKTMNRVFLMGHLGADPELRPSKSGRPYARLSLATERYMGPDAEKQTDWHSVFVFGDEAQRCANWLRKGALVFVEGSMSYWKLDKAGDDRESPYRNAIHADQVRFITYGRSAGVAENLDNPGAAINHNAVAHL